MPGRYVTLNTLPDLLAVPGDLMVTSGQSGLAGHREVRGGSGPGWTEAVASPGLQDAAAVTAEGRAGRRWPGQVSCLTEDSDCPPKAYICAFRWAAAMGLTSDITSA